MSGKITKGAQFAPEWATNIDLLAALKDEFPKGITSVLQVGVEMVWAEYGGLAEAMATAAARVRAGEDGP